MREEQKEGGGQGEHEGGRRRRQESTGSRRTHGMVQSMWWTTWVEPMRWWRKSKMGP